MSNPTANFGWVMPTATDLVTDLPADFAVFGQAVDTSMAGLLGGTTGQVLSKTSGTNMAFTWVTAQVGDITAVTAGTGISGGGTSGDVTITNSMATAITTSGDLIQGTGSGTFARLATGTSGQYLTTNGTTNSWVTPTSGSLTLLSTTTLSGATTTISSISQSYNSLFGIVYGATYATANGRLICAPNAVSTGTYSYNIEAGAIDSRNDDYMYFNVDPMTRTNANNAWAFTINNYTSTTAYKPFFNQGIFYSASSSALRYHSAAGGIGTNSAITSLQFTTTFTGGAFSTGTVLLYGVK